MPAERLKRRTHPAVTRAADKPKRSAGFLGPGGIALITIAAIFTLRGLPALAEYGWGSVFFYVVGALFFFIPLAFVAAELATSWPRAGGMYSWVRQGFGPQTGFLAVWFDWIENVVWFPTVLSFVAATLAYVINPSLASNKLYLVVVMLVVFWGLTLANFFGLQSILKLNNIALFIGTLFPAALLIGLGIYWVVAGRTSAIPFSAHALVPDLSSMSNVVFFAGVLLGFAGVEMAGYHAKETRNVRRDYPRAVFMSIGVILTASILATLAIAIVVPSSQLSLVSGLMQSFDAFFTDLGLGGWATKVMSALVGLGTLALISTWMIGPSKGVYAAEESGDLPPEVHYVNKRHVPVAMLIAQGIIGTTFSLMFLFIPNINTSYWMLTALTTQLTVLMYLLMLAAAIRLRYTEPNTPRPYRIPGGRYLGMWLVAGMGILGSGFGLIIGFIPPSGIAHWPAPIYALAMLGGIIVCSLPPILAHVLKKPSWRITSPDPVLLDLDVTDTGTGTQPDVSAVPTRTPTSENAT